MKNHIKKVIINVLILIFISNMFNFVLANNDLIINEDETIQENIVDNNETGEIETNTIENVTDIQKEKNVSNNENILLNNETEINNEYDVCIEQQKSSEILNSNIEENSNNSYIIEDGIYEIRTFLDTKMILDIDKNENVQIWNICYSDRSQKFQFTYDNEGYYTISDVRTGKVLDVYGGYTKPGTNVQMWEANGTDGQKWKIEKNGEGYLIISKVSNLYLDVYGGYTAAGTNVQVWTRNESNGQKWKIEESNKEEKIIDDGIYQIKTILDTKKVLDVTGGSLNNGANIEIWNNLNGDNQKFQFTYDNEGYYTISDVRTGKVLDVYGGYTKPGTNVQMWEANGTDGQKWKIEKNGEGYLIISKVSNLYLDVYGGYTAAGTNVQVWTRNESNGQKWKIEESNKEEKIIDDGIYQIKTILDTKKVLDVTGGSLNNGANIEIWNNLNGDNQKFQFTYDNEGYYTISDVRTGKVLDVYGGYTKPGTNVQMWEANGTDGQKWKIEKNGEGYLIISKVSNLYLDVYGGYTAAGTNVQVWTRNESNGQKWKIEESNKEEKIIDDGIYQIKTILDTKKVLDVTGGSLNNGANIEIWNNLNGDNQKFQFTYDNEGYYTISDVRTGKVLDVYGGYTKPGTNVQMWEANGTDGQKWKIEKNGEAYSIISKVSNLYLDVYGGYAVAGTNIQVWTNSESGGQNFIFEKTTKNVLENGIYEIQTIIDRNKVLDITGRSIENGANVEIWERTEANNQKFNITYVGDGYYTISDVRTGKMLDVYEGNTNPGTNVQMWEANGTDGQKWKIEKNGEGYAIISKVNNLYLDIYGGYTAAGTNVQVWTKNESNGQRFILNVTKVKNENKSNFQAVDTAKYPGYKDVLTQLQNAHPNWTIKLVYTGLDWNSVLTAEEGYSYGEPYSLTQAGGEWRNYSDSNSYQGGWYKASRKAIAYMMDPRNSLDQYYVFQFQNLARSSNETLENVSNITNGKYLQNYASTIVNASESYNVSAFHLASRMIQEQGNSGWSVNGYWYNNNGTMIKVYNFANINATGTTMDEIIANGSQYAFEHRWYTPEACIYGTAQYIYNNYLNHGQNTKYFEKYNVVVKPYYTNQYMQNIRAANDEGYATAKAFERNGLLNTPYEFLIPVYENMPVTACPRPSN